MLFAFSMNSCMTALKNSSLAHGRDMILGNDNTMIAQMHVHAQKSRPRILEVLVQPVHKSNNDNDNSNIDDANHNQNKKMGKQKNTLNFEKLLLQARQY